MFRIEWKEQVLRTFTERFDQLNESDQTRVMDSLDATDQLLAANPLEVGESRTTQLERIIIG